MIRCTFIVLIISLLINSVYAEDPNLPLHQVINKYRNSPAVDMNLKKTVVMSLLGETKESSGKLYLSSNKMRYEINKPEKHLVVMDGKSIWVENKLPKKLGGQTQVTHLKSKVGQEKVKGFLAAFFGNDNIKNDLDFKKITKNTYKVIFKKKSKMSDIKTAKIGIDKQAEIISFIEFTDSLENKTIHKFSNIKFKSQAQKSKFRYNIPANSEVTEL